MPRRRLDVAKAKADVCAALAAHNTVTAACGYAGINKQTFYRWLKMYKDFSDAVTRAEASSDVRLVSLIVKEAQAGTWNAAAWLLERHPRTKKDWHRTDEIRTLSTEQLIELATECDRRIESPGDRLALAEARTEPGPDPLSE